MDNVCDQHDAHTMCDAIGPRRFSGCYFLCQHGQQICGRRRSSMLSIICINNTCRQLGQRCWGLPLLVLCLHDPQLMNKKPIKVSRMGRTLVPLLHIRIYRHKTHSTVASFRWSWSTGSLAPYSVVVVGGRPLSYGTMASTYTYTPTQNTL